MVTSQTTLHRACCQKLRLIASRSDFGHAPHVRMDAAKAAKLRGDADRLPWQAHSGGTKKRNSVGGDIPSTCKRSNQHKRAHQLVDQALFRVPTNFTSHVCINGPH
jgi:hypothetical protein